jgi:hypothetical protein
LGAFFKKPPRKKERKGFFQKAPKKTKSPKEKRGDFLKKISSVVKCYI